MIRRASGSLTTGLRSLWTVLAAMVAVFDLRDLHVYSGVALIAGGTGAVYWPAGLIAAGVILLFVGLRRVD